MLKVRKLKKNLTKCVTSFCQPALLFKFERYRIISQTQLLHNYQNKQMCKKIKSIMYSNNFLLIKLFFKHYKFKSSLKLLKLVPVQPLEILLDRASSISLVNTNIPVPIAACTCSVNTNIPVPNCLYLFSQYKYTCDYSWM